MEAAKKIDEQALSPKRDSNHHLIREFIGQMSVSNNKTKKFYENILVDFYLYHGKAWQKLSIQVCTQYIEYLDRVHRYKHKSMQILKKKVKLILLFLKFMQEEGNSINVYIEVENHLIVQRLFPHKKKVRSRKSSAQKSTKLKSAESPPKIIEGFH
ncbi:hypothetical protein J416_14822 [Gracilibacillus halophilus YIM-C55.5]|uniref:Uncharacterized protein n=1 Tax=Gracilibacillus halophilus YIM-C55.5 TaxID=1308866 RepID=N4W653_9BACI|nr:hypothetical protein [Gracilibacillus halophilus]ENH95688.1 hypothetical protein J416_14822 [Gracilibacillus halophilus YIM-C55.5]